jgi:NACHT domain
VDVLEKIGKWFNGASDRRICWLKGPAGVGKSAIAQSVAEGRYQSGELAGSFFLRRGSADLSGFVPTIAYQLSISVPLTRASMENALYFDPSIPDQAYPHQFKKLIMEPLLTLKEPISHKVIVIDALDECDREGQVEELLAMLADACQDIRLPIRFFLTSRADNNQIQGFYDDSDIRSWTYYLDLEEFNARDDIRIFFESRFSMIYARNHRAMHDVPVPWPSQSDLNYLLAKSSGLFSIASAIVKLVSDGSDLPHRKLRAALEMNIAPDVPQHVTSSISHQEASINNLLPYLRPIDQNA